MINIPINVIKIDDFRILNRDFLEPKLQVYGNTAIASYTLMITRVEKSGITRKVHNETRVLVKQSGQWKIVHVHKSPAWKASYMEPEG